MALVTRLTENNVGAISAEAATSEILHHLNNLSFVIGC